MVLVGTSSSSTATYNPSQRKSFYANGRFWVFYAHNYYIYYTSSVDGETWTTPTSDETLASNSGAYFSVWFDGAYVHVAWCIGNNLRYKRGTPNSNGTITWGTAYDVLWNAFRDEFNADANSLWLVKSLITGNIYTLQRWNGAVEDYTTEVNIGSYGAGNKFVFTPYTTVTTPVGTSLPTTIQLKGWQYYVSAPAKLTGFEGLITVTAKVKNPTAVAHAGNLYARLWISDNPDLSGATALTSWSYASVSFSGTAGETKTVTINLLVLKSVGDAYAFKDKYFYIEFLWDVTTPATNARVQLEASLYTTVNAPNTLIYDPVITVDSNGYPWIGFKCFNGYNYFPYVAKGDSNTGTWNWRLASIRKLSTSPDTTWAVIPVRLTAGKMLIVYAVSADYIRSQYWDGTAWGTEKTTPLRTNIAYFSLIARGDVVNAVFLEYASYDIEHCAWASDLWVAIATVQTATTSTSIPVLSVDPATGNLYCFWAGSPTANHIYYKKYSAGAWSPLTDWIDESTEALTANNLLTCFHQVWNNKIGLLYMTKTTATTAPPYNVKFATISTVALAKRIIGNGLVWIVC